MMIHKHITIEKEHNNTLDQIIGNVVGVNNYSEAVRFLCMNYDPEAQRTRDTKLNAMSKEISIMLTILASSLVDSVEPDEISNYQEIELYKTARKIVNNNIQKNVTRSSKKTRRSIDENIETKKTIF